MIKERFPRFSFAGLLTVLFIYFLAHPIFSSTRFGSIFLELLISFILLSTVYILSENKRSFRIALAIALPALFLSWSNFLTYSIPRQAVAYVLDILFLFFAIAMIGRQVFRSKVIDYDVILGAICIYTLAGIAWGVAFTMTEMLQPGSFSGNLLPAENLNIIEEMAEKTVSLIYYSIVTLTTLGFGDIYPIAPIARSLSIIEALFGQFYIATMIATLIGLRTKTGTI